MARIEAIFLDAAGTIFGAAPLARAGVCVFDDAKELLQALKVRHLGGCEVKTGLVTNWGRKIHRVVSATGLRGHFDTIVSADDVMHCKPAAEPFLLAAASVGVSPQHCLFIGDSLYDDAFGAYDAGLQALWLNRRQVGLQGETERMLALLGHPTLSTLEEVRVYLESSLRGAFGERT